MPRIEFIETTAGEATAELSRRGVEPGETVTLAIDLDAGSLPGRRESRARVIAAGLTDEDLDRLIEEARAEVQPLLK